MFRYLYFVIPLIATYAAFYIWEILPDGNFWWSIPTWISLYAVVFLIVIIAISKFVETSKK